MRRYRKTAFLFLTPFLAVFIAFYLAPVGYALYLSLFIRKRIGVGPPKEVFGGLANYIRAVQDTDFLNGLKNMFVFGVVQVPVMLGLAILVALLLQQSRGFFMKICRTAFFMPYGIPTAIGALVWGYLYSANLSPFNQILQAFHQGKIDFLSPAVVLFSIANIVTWTWTGYNISRCLRLCRIFRPIFTRRLEWTELRPGISCGVSRSPCYCPRCKYSSFFR